MSSTAGKHPQQVSLPQSVADLERKQKHSGSLGFHWRGTAPSLPSQVVPLRGTHYVSSTPKSTAA